MRRNLRSQGPLANRALPHVGPSGDGAAVLMASRDIMARRMQMTPLRRPGLGEDVAGATQLRASDAAGLGTGQPLVVNDGTLLTAGS